MMSSLRVAACHLSPIVLNAKATTDKCIAAIGQAARNSANLVVFPETFIPAFPLWSALRPPTDNHDLFKRMVSESVDVQGKYIRAIRDAACQNQVVVSLGISEKVPYSAATLFNSNLIIDLDGKILVHHRKLMPTFFEKLTWSPGDGHGLRVANTKFGRIGNLICGENTNPLARYVLMTQGEQVHISSWPAMWPTRVPKHSTPSESRAPASVPAQVSKNYDNISANRIRAAAHCFEAKCFGVLCSGYLDKEAMKEISQSCSDPDFVAWVLQDSPRAATMFLDPTGAAIDGFVVRNDGSAQATELLQEEEDILYADLNLEDVIEGKQYHDVTGGYQRLDVFDLKVDRTRRLPVTFSEKGQKTEN